MSRVTEIRDLLFSREAAVRDLDGNLYPAFQRNSYIAKVDFVNGDTVVVVLPKNAARLPESRWIGKVVDTARMAMLRNKSVYVVPEES